MVFPAFHLQQKVTKSTHARSRRRNRLKRSDQTMGSAVVAFTSVSDGRFKLANVVYFCWIVLVGGGSRERNFVT